MQLKSQKNLSSKVYKFIRSKIANILIFRFAVVSWLFTIDYHLKFIYETIKQTNKPSSEKEVRSIKIRKHGYEPSIMIKFERKVVRNYNQLEKVWLRDLTWWKEFCIRFW